MLSKRFKRESENPTAAKHHVIDGGCANRESTVAGLMLVSDFLPITFS